MTLSDERITELTNDPFTDADPLKVVGHAVVISAEQPQFTMEENASRSASLLADLLALCKFDATVFPIQGSYNGKPEQSFIVSLPEQPDWDSELYATLQDGIIELGRKYDQESLMLIFRDSEEEGGGAFVTFVNDEFSMADYQLVTLDKDVAEIAKSLDHFVFMDVMYTTEEAAMKALGVMITDNPSEVLSAFDSILDELMDDLFDCNDCDSCGLCDPDDEDEDYDEDEQYE